MRAPFVLDDAHDRATCSSEAPNQWRARLAGLVMALAALMVGVAPVAAEVYRVDVTRLGQNLYRETGTRHLIQTRYCHEYARGERALYDSDARELISGGSTNCDVSRIIRAPSGAGLQYAAPGRGHWIEEVLADGEFIQLEDGSLWEVGPLSRVEAGIWLAVDDVIVAEGTDPTYPYQLVNTSETEIATARLIAP